MKYLAVAILFIGLVGLAWAFVPPPPANQNLGFYDTNVNLLTATACHNASCHGADDTAIANRHHWLIPTGQYACQNCHVTTPGVGNGVIVERDCIQCHNGTAWLGGSTGLNIGVPHHNSTQAQNRQCGNSTGCHGSYVDNYNDGHYIPPYNVSLVTPNTSFIVHNLTSGRYWGGCLACHQANASASPVINSNSGTHHNAFALVSTATLEGKCLWCHGNTPGQPSSLLGIRQCETCHSVKTIHNIQFEYESNGPLGKGHINNNWDCNGCHAFWDAGDATAWGIVVPNFATMSPTQVTAGTAIQMAITGSDFIQDTYSTKVVVDGVTYNPTSVTNTQIAVSLPALNAGPHEVKLVKGGEALSMTKGLVAIAPVSIASAQLASGTVTLVGTGFGTMPEVDAKNYVLVEQGGVQYMADSIASWTDTQIVATSSLAATNDKVLVLAKGGSATATITGGTVVDSVKVTYPNAAGLSWKRGTSKTITWDTAGSNQAANVKIELMQGSSVKRTLASSTLNDGSQSVSIPSSQSTGSYTIRVTSLSHSPTYRDSSDNTFRVTR